MEYAIYLSGKDLLIYMSTVGFNEIKLLSMRKPEIGDKAIVPKMKIDILAHIRIDIIMLDLVIISVALLVLALTSVTTVDAYGVIYEDAELGIKLEYPSSWEEEGRLVTLPCSELYAVCSVGFAPIETEWFPDFVEFTIYKDVGRARCECDNMTDFLRFRHEQLVEEADRSTTTTSFQFVDDNQTTIGKHNYSAWIVQYAKSFRNPTGNMEHHDSSILRWITNVNNSFYEFIFQSDMGDDFSKYYSDAKSILYSVEFIDAASNDSIQSERVPSFLQTSQQRSAPVG
jgi:hypothetical protein